MRTLSILFALALLIALGAWAYDQTLKTQLALERVEILEDKIARTREAITVQRAEWAYLNRPDRLRDLVDLNYETLGLIPAQPNQIGGVEEVPFPPPPDPLQVNEPAQLADLDGLDAPVDASATEGEDFP